MTLHIAKKFGMAVRCLGLMICVGGACWAGPAQKTRPPVRVTAKQANAVATKKFPGHVVGKTVLENEEGVWQYGVLVQSGKTLREVMVNARTGKIDSVEVTTAAKERVEAKADAAKAKQNHAKKMDDPKAERPEKGEKR